MVVENAIHPDYGIIWQEGQLGFEMLDTAHDCGYNKGYQDGLMESHQCIADLPDARDIEKSKPS